MIVPLPYSMLFDATREIVAYPTFASERDFHNALQTPAGLAKITFKDEKGIIGDVEYDDVNRLRLLLRTNRDDYMDFWNLRRWNPNRDSLDPFYLVLKVMQYRKAQMYMMADECKRTLSGMGYALRESKQFTSLYAPTGDKWDINPVFLMRIDFPGVVNYMFEVPLADRAPCDCEGGSVFAQSNSGHIGELCFKCSGRGWLQKDKRAQ